MKENANSELYETVINNLKLEPKIDNAETLTKNIINRIEFQKVNKTKFTVMKIVGAVSGVAAAFLICLLLSELFIAIQPYANNLVETQIAVSKNNESDAIENSTKIYIAHNEDISEILKQISHILQEKRKQKEQKERLYQAFAQKKDFSVHK